MGRVIVAKLLLDYKYYVFLKLYSFSFFYYPIGLETPWSWKRGVAIGIEVYYNRGHWNRGIIGVIGIEGSLK